MSQFKEVFSRDIDIKGSHAEKIKFLVGTSIDTIKIDFFDDKDELIDIKLFPTIADAFMVASAIGFINHSKDKEDKIESSARIFSDKARKISTKLEEIYQVMVFTDETYKSLELRQKFEKAFSSLGNDSKKESNEIFEYFISYARSGIDYLYNKAIKIVSLADLLKFYNDIILNFSSNLNE
jgi:hypothetical protein